jgi:hypothetical protein
MTRIERLKKVILSYENKLKDDKNFGSSSERQDMVEDIERLKIKLANIILKG